MNKIYFLSLLVLVVSALHLGANAQATINFESGGAGAAYTWAVFENGDNPALVIEANPDPTGINTSATVAKFTAKTAGQPYAGTESAHGDFGPLTFDASNSTIKIMVYKTVISDVGLKFAESSGEAQPEVKVANTKINEWEELTFDLSGSIGKGVTKILDQIIVFPDFATRAQDNIIYFDNISFSGQGTSGPDASLSTILVDGQAIAGFSSSNLNYTVELPEGTTVVPTVTATSSDVAATMVLTAATTIPGTTTILVTAVDGITKLTYSIDFKEEAAVVSLSPIDFESGGAGAAYTWAVFENGDNPALVIEANPNPSGINPSATVAKFTAKTAGQPYAGTESAHGDFGPLTFDASNSTIKIMVYKTVISDVGLKFAESSGEAQPEVKVANTKINEWEELTFDLSGSIGKGVTKILDQIIVFPDFATRAQDNIVYFDNIIVSGQAAAGPDASLSALLVDGQSVAGFSSSTLNYTVELDEGTTVVPTVTATSSDVAATVVLTAATSIPGTTTIVVTAVDQIKKSTYTIDFKIKAEEIEPTSLPIDFEGVAYGFVDFDGGTATVIANPQSSGINTSANVAQIVRNGGAMWAGSKLILKDKIDFSVNNAFQMKVYSTRVDVPMLFKLEGPNAAKEIEVKTTVANAWETITWDFTDTPSNTYDQVVFIFDFGTVGDGSANSTFLFDDVELIDNTGGLSKLDLPVLFEDETVNHTMTDFGGNSTILGIDPMNANNHVAITTKTTGAETWAGTTIGTNFGFASKVPFTTSGSKISVHVYSPAAGLTLRMKAEDHNDNTLTVETDAVTTKANEWENITFDFSTVATGTNPFNLSTNFDMVSIFFNYGTVGTDQVFYWDNVFFGDGEDVVIASALNFLDLQKVHVFANDDKLHIIGPDQLINSRVDIFNLSGQKVKSADLVDIETKLTIPARGVLIVRIVDKAEKTVTIRKLLFD